ncbi:hypothetical protein [Flavobacterium lacisediminis]|uniref:Uncharacterized protein n=1 Tax=Flavobacterium lacisediminis TaxID=2989705 RepID=A0ABT3EHI7_9FLAO|nr:hypothetical protein [Flavobacterium lacisediminis]MCW1148043.1 hypothetical protein [Flavobacterium lacisediminis]
MNKEDLARIINSIRSNSIEQLESANSNCFVFHEKETNSIISMPDRIYENIMRKEYRFLTQGYVLIQEPYLINDLKFYSIDDPLPF